jgi:hypothetical protein
VAVLLLRRLVPHPGEPAVEVGDSDPAPPAADPVPMARAALPRATAHAARGARRRHRTYDDVAARTYEAMSSLS